MSVNTEPIYKATEYQTIENSPLKQQWAMINKYKAFQFQKMKAKERQIDRQKKQSFRRELDNQLNNRSNAQQREREMDKKLSKGMNEKAEEMKRREEMQRYEKYIKRKHIQQQNMHNLEQSKMSKRKDYDTGYHLDIGMKSEQEHKEKTEYFKKNMMDTLDIQLKEKTEEAKRNKMINQQIEERHKQIINGYFQPTERKKYGQNQKIYEYYNHLEQEKQMKQREMEYLMVDSPMQRKVFQQKERERNEELRKVKDMQVVKYTLDAQVREGHQKRIQSSKKNPEEISYDFISNMFRPKQQAYDRDVYKRQLLQQAQEQRLRKIKENHMSQEQYRFNMNQLSKAVIGTYSQKNYLDRSLGAIGDNKKYELDSVKYDSKDTDADIIKNRLSSLRNKGTISFVEDRKQYLN